MIKQHTARSLGRYLDLEVLCNKKKGILKSVWISEFWRNIKGKNKFFVELEVGVKWFDQSMFNNSDSNITTQDIVLKNNNCMPILKDYTQLTVEDSEKAYGTYLDRRVIDRFFSVGQGTPTRVIASHLRVEELITLGYGAIKDKDSPTGHVDLWGYPCVLKERKEKKQCLKYQ